MGFIKSTNLYRLSNIAIAEELPRCNLLCKQQLEKLKQGTMTLKQYENTLKSIQSIKQKKVQKMNESLIQAKETIGNLLKV